VTRLSSIGLKGKGGHVGLPFFPSVAAENRRGKGGGLFDAPLKVGAFPSYLGDGRAGGGKKKGGKCRCYSFGGRKGEGGEVSRPFLILFILRRGGGDVLIQVPGGKRGLPPL